MLLDIRRTSMRSNGHHALLIGVLAPVLLCAGCGGPPLTAGTSEASCVGPYLNDQPPSGPFSGQTPTVSPRSAIMIYGHWYTGTCNDTGGHDPLKPLPPVHLTLTLPGGAAEALGEFNAQGPDLGFSTTVEVPAGTPAGTATVRDDQPHPATYTFKIGQEPGSGQRTHPGIQSGGRSTVGRDRRRARAR